jgi:cysteine synthase A
VSGKYANILETIGRTPCVRVAKLSPKGVNLYVKIESFNPMGSVKDRLAIGVIEDAEKSGALKPGQTVIEGTSGNTGIGLAMVCAQKDYPLVVTMAENFSVERRKMMRFLGAKVVLTPASEKGTGMLAKAAELAERHGWFLCRQFENEANADIHSKTTAPEILEAFADEGLDYWVTGFGTGGTLKGVARVLKEKSPATKVVVCEPDNSPVLGSGIAQPRDAKGAVSASHPLFRPHLMQGWAPDFIAGLTEDAVALDLIDEIVPIDGEQALQCARDLARKEGIFVGITGGATFSGALKVAEQAPQGSTILCMLPDTGERYLTTTLFEDIPVEMTDVEIEISESTLLCRFGAPPPKPKEQAEPEPAPLPVTAEAEAFLDEVLGDTEQPVVMFALEWCEFCWSVRKMFAKAKIPYRSVDLDSVEYQKDDRGGKIRASLTARTGIKTIPQIFVGGQLVGGATELFDSYKSGEFQKLLEAGDVPFDPDQVSDPYTFLPTWLHPR